jgi:hypothetical protein
MILKDHKFWLGIVVALVLVGFFPQLNFIGQFRQKGNQS